jgi:hypothetical protein
MRSEYFTRAKRRAPYEYGAQNKTNINKEAVSSNLQT